MCGRITRDFEWQQLLALLNCVPAARIDLPRSYNIAPTQSTGILIDSPDGPTLTPARWGLIPSWSRDAGISSKTINARSETVDQLPSYRDAYRARRCVIPISGFYEWATSPAGKRKQPYYITRADREIMMLAGVWESWNDPNGEPESAAILSYTVITTNANSFMLRIHDRMPVILEPERVLDWIDHDHPLDASLMQPAADGVLIAHPVGMRVNSPLHDDPSLIEVSQPERGLFE